MPLYLLLPEKNGLLQKFVKNWPYYPLGKKIYIFEEKIAIKGRFSLIFENYSFLLNNQENCQYILFFGPFDWRCETRDRKLRCIGSMIHTKRVRGGTITAHLRRTENA